MYNQIIWKEKFWRWIPATTIDTRDASTIYIDIVQTDVKW